MDKCKVCGGIFPQLQDGLCEWCYVMTNRFAINQSNSIVPAYKEIQKEIYVVIKHELETDIVTVMCSFNDRKAANIYMTNQRHKKRNLGCNFKMIPTELK